MQIVYGRENLDDTLKIVNSAFCPVREDGFDFRQIMPKAYGEKCNLLQYHYIVKDGEKGVAAAGNIPGVIATSQGDFPFVFLGSVATLPECQGKGYMRALMERVDVDNRQNQVVFSMLTGARKRYVRHGYTKCFSTLCYTFDCYFHTHAASDCSLLIDEFKAEDLDEIFDVYQEFSPLKLRTKESFVPCLQFSKSQLRTVRKDGKIVGYYTFATRKNLGVGELCLSDLSIAASLMKAVADFENVKTFNVLVNPLDVRLASVLDGICEGAALSDGLQIKVYDMARFVQMLLALNLDKGIKRLENVQETISIGGECFEVCVNDGKASVQKTDKKPQFSFEVAEFLRLAINGASRALDESKIFPLTFGISAPDEF